MPEYLWGGTSPKELKAMKQDREQRYIEEYAETIKIVLDDDEKAVVEYLAREENKSFKEELKSMLTENLQHYVNLYLGQAKEWEKEKENRTSDGSVIEYCGEANGLPSIVVFSHRLGVRIGYVGFDGAYSSDIERMFDRLDAWEHWTNYEYTYDRETAHVPQTCNLYTRSELNKIYDTPEDKLISTGGYKWVSYSCNGLDETFDKDAIQRYFSPEADSMIDRFSHMRDYKPRKNQVREMRSLDWCKNENANIAALLKAIQKGLIDNQELDLTQDQDRGRS